MSLRQRRVVRPPTEGLYLPDPSSTASALAQRTRLRPRLAIVLGSGFQHAVARLRIQDEIPYAKLPGFPQSTVPGHQGKALAGWFGATAILVLSGRAHYYEGHSLATVTFPVRVLAEFGIQDLLLTNAAGGIMRALRPGDFMALKDHINLMGANPLRGAPMPGRERFVDLSAVYDARLTRCLQRAGHRAGVRVRTGVYLAVSGPSYETPAEIRAFARLGADAVGMSTVPEAIVARQCGLRVAGLSCITNAAAGRGNASLSHADVLEAGERVKFTSARLVEEFVRLYAQRR